MKGISPLMATVLIVAFTLAVAAIIGGWLTSISRTETSTIESGMSTQIECTKAQIDIVSVDSDGPVIQNIGQVNFTSGFALVCGTNTSTTSTSLNVGEFLDLTSGTGCNTTGNVVRVSSIDCPGTYAECTYGTDCPS